MIHAYPTKATSGEIPSDAIWIDLLDGTEEEKRAITQATGIAVPSRDLLSEIENSSRMSARDDVIRLSTPITARKGEHAEVSPVGFVLTPHHLLTVRFADPPSFQVFGENFDKLPANHRCSAGAFIGLMEAIVDRLADVLELNGGELDKISRTIFAGDEGRDHNSARMTDKLKEVLRIIGRMSDRVSKVRDSLLGISRIMPFVAEKARAWTPPELVPRFETIERDIASLADYDRQLTDKIQFLLDATLGFINVEQNNIFKTLTVFSIVGIPPTLLAGIYGMNFKNMPEYDWTWGYAYGWAVIILSAVIPLWWFRRRGWI